MQRLMVAFLAGIAVLLIGSGVRAELKMPLGKWNAAVKVDYLQFTDDVFDEEVVFYELDAVAEPTTYLSKDGAYFGFETYANVWENLYVGAEIGYVKTEQDIADWINRYRSAGLSDVRGTFWYEFSTEIEYIPVQLNVKYVLKPSENVICSIGGGISYNYAEVSVAEKTAPGSVIGSASLSLDDWLFGGQVFAELLYTIDRYFIGISGAYQFTEDFDDEGGDDEGAPNFNNFRLGGKIGFYF